MRMFTVHHTEFVRALDRTLTKRECISSPDRDTRDSSIKLDRILDVFHLLPHAPFWLCWFVLAPFFWTANFYDKPLQHLFRFTVSTDTNEIQHLFSVAISLYDTSATSTPGYAPQRNDDITTARDLWNAFRSGPIIKLHLSTTRQYFYSNGIWRNGVELL